jgi:hypothetical protein
MTPSNQPKSLTESPPVAITISDVAINAKERACAGEDTYFTEAKLAKLVLSFDTLFCQMRQHLEASAIFEPDRLFEYIWALLWFMIKKKPADTGNYILAAKLWLHGAGSGAMLNADFDQALNAYINSHKPPSQPTST